MTPFAFSVSTVSPSGLAKISFSFAAFSASAFAFSAASAFAFSSASCFSLIAANRFSSISLSFAAVSIGRAAPNGLAFASPEVEVGDGSAGDSETVLFARFSFGRPAGIAWDGAGDEGASLPSRDGIGDFAAGASGRIFVRHWLSCSAAVGVLSATGLS